jgi:DNA primase
VAGRISDADKERVRDASRIEQVVGEYVALRNAGGGNLKGLCPFHDEKTPSFQVSPARGYYHCFGCGQGGDVFTFLQEIEHLTFVEAVQRLAERFNIPLTMTEGGTSTRAERGTRPRLLAANKAAAEFYAAQLSTPGAETARAFLAERGFDMAAAAHFGCGYAPDGWDALVKALTSAGFSLEELYKAGLARQGQRGPIDQFHRRLLWAIRDNSGEVVGFGARRLYDDDRLEAKYINTSETMLYKKSQVLFGLDLAKRDISRQRRVVVVEGYTDVMAMHLAGVTTAVASCGTAFGEEHISVLRRYLLDSDVIRGEVVYTFDGDAAGQKAALKAFDSDQRFAANTFIAVAPAGMDPCELRQAKGDEAVRALVENRTPLFNFAVTSVLAQYDLDTAEGRVAATAAAVPLVARIKESTLRDEYIRRLAGLLGSDLAPIRQRVKEYDAAAARAARQRPAPTREQHGDDRGRPARLANGGQGRHPGTRPSGPGEHAGDRDRAAARRPAGAVVDVVEPPDPDLEPPADPHDNSTDQHQSGQPAQPAPGVRRPDPADRSLMLERQALQLALQRPDLVVDGYPQVREEAFTHPAYAAVHRAVAAAGGPPGDGSTAAWVDVVADSLPSGVLRSLVTELAVQPPPVPPLSVNARYAGAIIAGMAERVAAAQEREFRSALQRAEASGDRERARTLSADLAAVAQYRRALADRARGDA